MRTLGLCIAVLVLFACPLFAAERFNVRVLYCGEPGSEREADFRAFLAEHFAKVSMANISTFATPLAQEHDVVIFDSNCICTKGAVDWTKYEESQKLAIDQDFARPAILIARNGGAIAIKRELMTDWLCLCLEGPAYKPALDHPLFHAPLEVNVELEEIVTPADFVDRTLDKSLGPTMQVWRVQTKDYPDIDAGLVSNLYGFLDSPDTELIAQGVAAKGPDTVSLGRHANFFMWGFSAPPADMTPSGRRLLINVINYMLQFDGQAPLVRKKAMGREWALRYAAGWRWSSEEWRTRAATAFRATETKYPEQIPDEHHGDADAYVKKYVDSMQSVGLRYLKHVIPESVREECGTDADKYEAYYTTNFEYLRADDAEQARFIVDEDAKLVGPSNRRVELLERCVTMLEQNDRPELATRLLKRYTEQTFEQTREWRAWLDKNRDRLFFSDAGGFRFFVGPPRNRMEQAK